MPVYPDSLASLTIDWDSVAMPEARASRFRAVLSASRRLRAGPVTVATLIFFPGALVTSR